MYGQTRDLMNYDLKCVFIPASITAVERAWSEFVGSDGDGELVLTPPYAAPQGDGSTFVRLIPAQGGCMLVASVRKVNPLVSFVRDRAGQRPDAANLREVDLERFMTTFQSAHSV
jgi:hypothetical protein